VGRSATVSKAILVLFALCVLLLRSSFDSLATDLYAHAYAWQVAHSDVVPGPRPLPEFAWVFAICTLPLVILLPERIRSWAVASVLFASFCIRLAGIPALPSLPSYSRDPSAAHSNFRREALRVTMVVKESVSSSSHVAEFRITGREVKVRRQWFSISDLAEEEKSAFPVLVHFEGARLYGGCKVHARISLRAMPREIKNESYASYVHRLGAVGTLRLEPWQVLAIECGSPGWRDSVTLFIERSLGHRFRGRTLDASLGFVLGQAGTLDSELKTSARELGILHVFAASGMHLAIIYGVIFLPASFLLGRRHPISALLPIGPCFLYLWLLGFPVSLARAFAFAVVYALTCLFHRRLTSTTLLLNSAILLLFWMPEDFATLSSALSFGAVAGIFYFASPLLTLFRLKGPSAWIWGQVSVSACAGIFTTPLLIFVFGGFSFSSLPANLVAVPLSDLALPVLFGGLGLESMGAPEQVLEIAWKPAQWIMSAFIFLTERAGPHSLYNDFDSIWSLPLFAALGVALTAGYILIRPVECGRRLRVIRALSLVSLLALSPVGGWVGRWFDSSSARGFIAGFFGVAHRRASYISNHGSDGERSEGNSRPPSGVAQQEARPEFPGGAVSNSDDCPGNPCSSQPDHH